jgi:hypothetical protein
MPAKQVSDGTVRRVYFRVLHFQPAYLYGHQIDRRVSLENDSISRQDFVLSVKS